jgi:hypothetical protein
LQGGPIELSFVTFLSIFSGAKRVQIGSRSKPKTVGILGDMTLTTSE